MAGSLLEAWSVGTMRTFLHVAR